MFVQRDVLELRVEEASSVEASRTYDLRIDYFQAPSVREMGSYQCTLLVPLIVVEFTALPFTNQLVVLLPGWPVILLPLCPAWLYKLTAIFCCELVQQIGRAHV